MVNKYVPISIFTKSLLIQILMSVCSNLQPSKRLRTDLEEVINNTPTKRLKVSGKGGSKGSSKGISSNDDKDIITDRKGAVIDMDVTINKEKAVLSIEVAMKDSTDVISEIEDSKMKRKREVEDVVAVSEGIVGVKGKGKGGGKAKSKEKKGELEKMVVANEILVATNESEIDVLSEEIVIVKKGKGGKAKKNSVEIQEIKEVEKEAEKENKDNKEELAKVVKRGGKGGGVNGGDSRNGDDMRSSKRQRVEGDVDVGEDVVKLVEVEGMESISKVKKAVSDKGISVKKELRGGHIGRREKYINGIVMNVMAAQKRREEGKLKGDDPDVFQVKTDFSYHFISIFMIYDCDNFNLLIMIYIMIIAIPHIHHYIIYMYTYVYTCIYTYTEVKLL
jgi:hypothetical protein